ncbi:SHOCT domain-containing protein [Streptomyces sp. NPDC053542]|uniref:SHOCT domain-containing protein n=1 Tax=Streptomyces sp. NPDC053542 TaxID=3365710 RepID=UPI0037D75C40
MSDVMYGYGTGMTGWGFVVMAVAQLLFWILLLGGVALLVRYLVRGHRDAGTTPVHQTPEQVLAGRYARGEIDEEEYRRRLTALRGG